ncbi:hypothetical protein ACXO20_09205, partial [Lactobacillus delbrueckii subsp. bulgaricus]
MRFLDWKVSEINKLIGIRRKEIQELEALKSAVISDTVTGKIDVRNIIGGTGVMVEYNSYKKSSYDWLGKIPS